MNDRTRHNDTSDSCGVQDCGHPKAQHVKRREIEPPDLNVSAYGRSDISIVSVCLGCERAHRGIIAAGERHAFEPKV